MGTVKKLLNGRYQIDVYDQSGKRRRKHFKNKRDAQALINKIEQEKYDAKLAKNNLIREKYSIRQAIEEVKVEKEQLSAKSYKKYKNVFHQFELFVTDNYINYADEFTREHADQLKSMLIASSASAVTINFYLMTIKALFTDLVNRDVIIKNPFNHIKYQRVKRKTLSERENEYYDEKELAAFFSQENEDEYRYAFTGLLLSGLRIEELSSLQWDNIDWKNKIIEIRSNDTFQTKTATSERDIPMSNKLYSLLKIMKGNSTSEYVFCSRTNDKLSERTLLSNCKRIAKKAGITKNATLHMFRHSFNSHLTQMGVDYVIRQYLMGHKPESMTDRYTKIDPKKLHDEVSKLDKLIPA